MTHETSEVVPHGNVAFGRAQGECVLVLDEFDRVGYLVSVLHCFDAHARVQVPYLECGVVRAAGELIECGYEAERANRAGVSEKGHIRSVVIGNDSQTTDCLTGANEQRSQRGER